MPKVLLGMSGGVDSATAAFVLQRDGHEVVGATLRFHDLPSFEEDCARAQAVCGQLGIEHHIVDVRDAFASSVQAAFADAYGRGLTPNPCTRCNATVKFPALINAADRFGCGQIATGHYATVCHGPAVDGRLPYRLQRAADPAKDQSYMLYGLSQDILARTLFPLADLHKAQVRKMAEEAGLAAADTAESQDICFIEGDDYAAWLEDEAGLVPQAGDIVSASDGSVLGRHQGLHRYTIGQRKGIPLGGGTGEPLYVVAKDVEGNRLLVAGEAATFVDGCQVADLRWTSIEAPTTTRHVTVKLRYRQEAVPAQLVPQEGDRLLVAFEEPQRAVAAGQAAVFYDGDLVLGGGTITDRSR
ncbi:MAG: tRNA 2-thiouridine(34) synthase MnmA [Coriobacteriaceae bacterium]|nr:tRNA 2-thiouridine(34) synthase MnmA [Coriobacteriaceae bacterium]